MGGGKQRCVRKIGVDQLGALDKEARLTTSVKEPTLRILAIVEDGLIGFGILAVRREDADLFGRQAAFLKNHPHHPQIEDVGIIIDVGGASAVEKDGMRKRPVAVAFVLGLGRLRGGWCACGGDGAGCGEKSCAGHV